MNQWQSFETDNLELFELIILNKDNQKKFNQTIHTLDLENKEWLDQLNTLTYEEGDQISIHPKNLQEISPMIHGVAGGEIDTTQEDYKDGVQNEDYIYNVRFQLTNEGVQTIYNAAPVIHGLEPLEVSAKEDVNLLKGVSISDDKDGNMSLDDLQVEVESESEQEIIYRYTVTDSWGRSTTGTRRVIIRPNTIIESEDIEIYNVNRSLNNLRIKVGGVAYSGNLTERFQIQFDTKSKQIKLLNQDGRLMNTKVQGEYFEFEIFDKNMKRKASVTLNGTDKSDSEKLDVIKNIPFEIGDYISLWHIESSSKLSITGNIVDKDGTSIADQFDSGIDENKLINHRFELTNQGLKDIENNAPYIDRKTLSPLTIARGQSVDLLDGIKVIDDHDNFDEVALKAGQVSIEHTSFDNSILGEHTITYTATDKWGLSSTATRTVNVATTNDLENTVIEGYTKDNQLAFRIGFDSLKKELRLIENNNVQLDPNNEGIAFRLKVTRDGVVQRTLNLKGTDYSEAILHSKLEGYRYQDGDRIEVWSSYPQTGIKIVGNIADIPSDGENYADGINNVDYMNNVRFEMAATQLKYVYNKAPEFSEFDELTVTRTEDASTVLKNGFTVTDDHDKNLTSKVTYEALDTSVAGTYKVRYKATDSWGRSTSVLRTVTVTDYTPLETNAISFFKPNTDEELFVLNFDDQQKRLSVSHFNPMNNSTKSSDVIVKIGLYESSGSEKELLELTAQQLEDKSWIETVEDWTYTNADFIFVWSSDLQGIQFHNFTNTKNVSDEGKFTSEDAMANTRFELNSEGLKAKYNAAPTFKGLEKLYLFKGTAVNDDTWLKDVTASDDMQENISINSSHVSGTNDVNVNLIGDYIVTYTVTDSWGRTTTQTRQVSVISKSVANTLELYGENDEKILTFRYNSIKNGFDVIKHEATSSQSGEIIESPSTTPEESNPTLPEESTPDTDGSGTPNSPEESIPDAGETETNGKFLISIFDKTGTKTYEIALTEDNWKSDGFFNELEEVEIQDGYFFSVWAADFSRESSKIRIQGDMVGTNQLGESGDQSEDYSDGIQNKDFMTNVRFQITDDGIKSVYNKAPQIQFDTNLSVLKGDKINYETGVVLTDDHDGNNLTFEGNVQVTPFTGEGELGNNNVATYVVTDSWGRTTKKNRNVTLENALAHDTINITGIRNQNMQLIETAFKIGFDIDTRKLYGSTRRLDL